MKSAFNVGLRLMLEPKIKFCIMINTTDFYSLISVLITLTIIQGHMDSFIKLSVNPEKNWYPI